MFVARVFKNISGIFIYFYWKKIMPIVPLIVAIDLFVRQKKAPLVAKAGVRWQRPQNRVEQGVINKY